MGRITRVTIRREGLDNEKARRFMGSGQLDSRKLRAPHSDLPTVGRTARPDNHALLHIVKGDTRQPAEMDDKQREAHTTRVRNYFSSLSKREASHWVFTREWLWRRMTPKLMRRARQDRKRSGRSLGDELMYLLRK